MLVLAATIWCFCDLSLFKLFAALKPLCFWFWCISRSILFYFIIFFQIWLKFWINILLFIWHLRKRTLNLLVVSISFYVFHPSQITGIARHIYNRYLFWFFNTYSIINQVIQYFIWIVWISERVNCLVYFAFVVLLSFQPFFFVHKCAYNFVLIFTQFLNVFSGNWSLA